MIRADFQQRNLRRARGIHWVSSVFGADYFSEDVYVQASVCREAVMKASFGFLTREIVV